MTIVTRVSMRAKKGDDVAQYHLFPFTKVSKKANEKGNQNFHFCEQI